MTTSTGQKHDEGKNRLDLIPPAFILGVGEVLTHGAVKYGDYNYLEVEDASSRYYAAAQRHLNALWGGEVKDPDSGLPHIFHAITSLLMFNEVTKK